MTVPGIDTHLNKGMGAVIGEHWWSDQAAGRKKWVGKFSLELGEERNILCLGGEQEHLHKVWESLRRRSWAEANFRKKGN